MPEQVVENEVVDDRRAAIEAAFESAAEVVDKPVVVETKAPTEVKEPVQQELPFGESKETSTKPAEATDRPPQSWKPSPKTKWATLDPEIKQEVLRRETETTRVLNETAQARQIATQFQQAVQPFMARIASLNAHPITAVTELLKADHILSTAPKVQKAQFLAKLISDYGVDIEALDQVLSGKAQQVDPVDSKVEQLLQQRLAPFQQFLTQQQQVAAWQEQQVAAELEQTVESMAADTAKFPHFQQVRESMADIVELYARRGQTIGIEAAYNKAVAMDPATSQVFAQQLQNNAAAKLNGRAQKALAASVSVNGAPTGPISSVPSSNDRRATIAAAFDASASR